VGILAPFRAQGAGETFSFADPADQGTQVVRPRPSGNLRVQGGAAGQKAKMGWGTFLQEKRKVPLGGESALENTGPRPETWPPKRVATEGRAIANGSGSGGGVGLSARWVWVCQPGRLGETQGKQWALGLGKGQGEGAPGRAGPSDTTHRSKRKTSWLVKAPQPGGRSGRRLVRWGGTESVRPPRSGNDPRHGAFQTGRA